MGMLAKKTVQQQSVCADTPKNIARQDFVDNKIFELINELLPRRKKIDWDIEVIANVRTEIFFSVCDKVGGLDERKFYP